MPGRARTRAMARMGAREAIIFRVIADYVAAHGAFPSSVQVLDAAKWGDRGRIVDNMARLERRGYIRRPRRAWNDGGQITALGALTLEWAALFPHRLKQSGGFGVKHSNHSAKTNHRQAALSEGRTFHPYAVVAYRPKPLGLGRNVTKLGNVITKGWAKGKTMYYLALEERATCPRSCTVWDTCYGNSLPFMKRNTHGTALQQAIMSQLAAIFKPWRIGKKRDAAGIMVRLHELGDFYDVRYVAFWDDMLTQFPGLSLFGYTAHHPGTPIGDAVADLHRTWGKRAFIRHSNYIGVPSARVVKNASEAWGGEIVCPEQTGRVKDCASCGLCWTMQKRVVFLAH